MEQLPRGPGRGGRFGSQKVYPLSLRDADMDVGGRAPTVGALGDAWSSCREGQGEGASSVVKKYIPSPSGRGPGRGGKFGSQKVHPLSLRERARERGYNSGRVSG